MMELSTRERIILSIDTSSKSDAEYLVRVAKEAGARFVKFGLELSSATSWQYCAELAARNQLEWIADAKLDDIPGTVAAAVRNIKSLEHKPFGITMHTTAGKEAMRAAQEEAGDSIIFGVTILTSLPDEEALELYGTPTQHKVLELARSAVSVGIKGVVTSPLEVGSIKGNLETQDLIAMIPGTRSVSTDKQDQSRTATPAAAIRDGADLIVIGRQITESTDPAQAYAALAAEINKELSS